ncbi:MAG: metallophosphatase domain-containing protein [Chlamydiales bacterium]
MVLITCISDLHGYKPKLAAGDLLIVAGDLTARDTKDEYMQFMLWLNELPYRCKIVIAGNHDGLIESGKVTISGPSIHYLCDSGFEFEGLKIWGSPYTPTFLSWYFMRNRGEEIKRHWDLIPPNIDILVTHGPPHGIFDETIDEFRVGCEELRRAVQERVKPRIHCFGHIHEGGGSQVEIDGTTYINCSYVDERYRPVNAPMVISIPSKP